MILKSKKNRFIFLGIALIVLAIVITSIFNTLNKKEAITISGKTMGTTYHVKYIENNELKLSQKEISQQIELILKDVNAKMSTYMDNSELSLFNQSKKTNKSIEVSEDLARVVTEAIRLNQATGGALDITVGPVVNLWGFGPEKKLDKEPTDKEIKERKAWVGIDKLKVTEKDGKYYFRKSIPELYVDLSSIAKGFGVDKVADYLSSIGLKNYLVEIGGEILAQGTNAEDQFWQIAIEKPTADGSREIQEVIGLENFAMATSGDYRNYFENDGKRFSHEIDPFTGRPITHNLASITVLAPSTMTADGLATGLFVLGAEKALEFAEQNNIAVYLIIKTDEGFEIKMSSRFQALLAPTTTN